MFNSLHNILISLAKNVIKPVGSRVYSSAHKRWLMACLMSSLIITNAALATTGSDSIRLVRPNAVAPAKLTSYMLSTGIFQVRCFKGANSRNGFPKYNCNDYPVSEGLCPSPYTARASFSIIDAGANASETSGGLQRVLVAGHNSVPAEPLLGVSGGRYTLTFDNMYAFADYAGGQPKRVTVSYLIWCVPVDNNLSPNPPSMSSDPCSLPNAPNACNESDPNYK